MGAPIYKSRWNSGSAGQAFAGPPAPQFERVLEAQPPSRMGMSLQKRPTFHSGPSALTRIAPGYSFTHLIAPCGCEYAKGFL